LYHIVSEGGDECRHADSVKTAATTLSIVRFRLTPFIEIHKKQTVLMTVC